MNDKSTLLESLNEAQKQAVEYNDGPQLIIACAGSGKTRVLTYKIAYLLTSGMKPYNILAMTFTRKAANEMKERIDKLCGEGMSSELVMGTFHSIFAKLLRIEHKAAGLSSNFIIYDQSDSINTIKDCIVSLNLSSKIYDAREIQARISWLKNNRMHTPHTYIGSEEENEDISNSLPMIGKIFSRYQQKLEKADALDFDDILNLFCKLLETNPIVCEKWASKFRYILVDEFQDTNFVQAKIVSLLSTVHNKVCVVGDDAQSIYAFRGAVIDNILNFTDNYPGAVMFKLEENYRSTPDIISAANDVISKNKKQIKKDVFTNNPAGDKVHIINTKNKFEEADYIANFIEKDVKDNAYDKYTILYRMNSQSSQIETAFQKKKIPYKIYGGVTFFQREEIKNLTSYLKLAVNTGDDESFKRIFDYPARRIADRTLKVIQECADKHSVSLFDAINPENNFEMEFVNKGFERRVTEFYNMITSFRNFAKIHNVVETSEFIYLNSGMKADMENNMTEIGKEKLNNVQELFNMESEMIKEKGEDTSLSEFLSEISLSTMDGEEDDDTPKVKLMTMHGSKGLEFDTVFIIGCIEGIFPMTKIKDTIVNIDEERRLAYVAMTRAQKRLFMITNEYNILWGNTYRATESRFTKDISKEFIKREEIEPADYYSRLKSWKNNTYDDFEDDDDEEEIIDEYEDEYSLSDGEEAYDRMCLTEQRKKQLIAEFDDFKVNCFWKIGQRSIKLFLGKKITTGDKNASICRYLLDIEGENLNAKRYHKKYNNEIYHSKNSEINSLMIKIRNNEVDMQYALRECAVPKDARYEVRFTVKETGDILYYHCDPYEINLKECETFTEKGKPYPEKSNLSTIKDLISKFYGEELYKKYEVGEDGICKRERVKAKKAAEEKLKKQKEAEERRLARIEEQKRFEEQKAKEIVIADNVYTKLSEMYANGNYNAVQEFTEDELRIFVQYKHEKNAAKTMLKTLLNGIKRKNNTDSLHINNYGSLYDSIKQCGQCFYIMKNADGLSIYLFINNYKDKPCVKINTFLSKKAKKKIKNINEENLAHLIKPADFCNILIQRTFENKNSMIRGAKKKEHSEQIVQNKDEKS